MIQETKHTPLPWTLCRSTTNGETMGFHFAGKIGSSHPIISCDDYHVFTASEMEANAQFIDRAIHSHDALVEALLTALPFVQDCELVGGYKEGATKKAEQKIMEALKLAGAE